MICICYIEIDDLNLLLFMFEIEQECCVVMFDLLEDNQFILFVCDGCEVLDGFYCFGLLIKEWWLVFDI